MATPLTQHITDLIGASTSYTFIRRATLVRDYLMSTAPRPVPVRVMGEGGFDFVLSDQGLDLFFPKEPNQEELIRYYTFRRTGRRAIGIPDYLTYLVPSMESPTGPSQMMIRLQDLQVLIQQELAQQGLAPECVDDVLGCLKLEALATIVPTGPRIAASVSPLAPGPNVPNVRGVTTPAPGIEEVKVVRIDMERYRCLLAGVRCWQLAGSVYRGIMEELPRVIATIWSEILAGTNGLPTSYSQRFPSQADNGMRQIFRERLETALPTDMQMRFESYGGSDVRITNQGIFFPDPPPQIPAANAIFVAIRDGAAANPVFTDSFPPPPE